MDPISNKKDFEDLTTNLRDLAYSYIEKYSPSKQQVKTYLLKKYLKKFQGSKSKKDISAIIDKIVSNLEKLYLFCLFDDFCLCVVRLFYRILVCT